MKNKIKILSSLLIVTILILNIIVPIVAKADNPETGKLTINKRGLTAEEVENLKGSVSPETSGKPLANVTFRIYKVADEDSEIEDESVDIPERYKSISFTEGVYTSGNDYAAEKTTGADGQVVFDNLPLGRYLVVEYDAPDNVVSKIDSFLIDIPYTTGDGTTLDYAPVITPKNTIIYGNVELEKVGKSGETETPLDNVTFILEKEEDGVWKEVETDSDLTTDSEGKIKIEGLLLGKYRFVEKSLGTHESEGYILDNKTTYLFEVKMQSEGEPRGIVTEPSSIKVINDKPQISKTIETVGKNENTENTKTDGTNSADIGDTINYKLTVDVPSAVENMDTYKIKDTIDEYLEYIDINSLEIKGYKKTSSVDEVVTLSSGTDYNLSDSPDKTFEITFVSKDNLKDCYKIEITYKAKIKEEAKEHIKSEGYKNTAEVAYSSKVTNDYKNNNNSEIQERQSTVDATIQTGGLKFEKKAKTKSGDPLANAEFRIADSEENAKAKKFIKDANGTEIIITTGEDGIGEYYGLTYGTYYLVETKAPKDEATGRNYNLLRKPVEITIGDNTYNTSSQTIVNRLGFILPATGGIGAAILIIVGVSLIGIQFVSINKKSKKEEKK